MGHSSGALGQRGISSSSPGLVWGSDPIPFVDEVMLALLTFRVGSWRARKADQRPVDVTHELEGDKAPPDQP